LKVHFKEISNNYNNYFNFSLYYSLMLHLNILI
jgi:hypothetical protein